MTDQMYNILRNGQHQKIAAFIIKSKKEKIHCLLNAQQTKIRIKY